MIERWCLSDGPLDACSLESGQGSANATLTAAAGQLYQLRIEYKEVVDSASVKLYYSSPSIIRSIVPSSRLFHSAEVFIHLRQPRPHSATEDPVHPPCPLPAARGIQPHCQPAAGAAHASSI